MPTKGLFSAVKSLFGFTTHYIENPLVNEVAAAVTQIMRGNPLRVGLVVVNLSGNTMFIAPTNNVSAAHGIYLAPNGGSASMVWDRDFEMCSMPWYAIAGAANSDVYVLEYIMDS
jgi:hypothetical protein